jgi:putative intracellular protease/amidase
MSTSPIRVVLLGYAGVQTLDLAGPLDAFASANSAQAGAYLTLTTSLDGPKSASVQQAILLTSKDISKQRA